MMIFAYYTILLSQAPTRLARFKSNTAESWHSFCKTGVFYFFNSWVKRRREADSMVKLGTIRFVNLGICISRRVRMVEAGKIIFEPIPDDHFQAQGIRLVKTESGTVVFYQYSGGFHKHAAVSGVAAQE